MLKFCEAFLRHRKAVVALFAVAAVACALCIPAVKVNYSMTDYLPADAPSIQALDDMEQSFDGGIPNARLFAEGHRPGHASSFPATWPPSTAWTR